jgi:hypothetical protein
MFICICISTLFLLIKAISSAQALVLHTTFPILRPKFEDVSLSRRGFTYSLYISVLNMPYCRSPWSTSNGVRPIIRQSDSPTNAIFLWNISYTITCVIWGQKPNRLLTKERSRTSETRYHRRQTIGRATQELKKHIYEQRGLHKNLDPIVMNR